MRLRDIPNLLSMMRMAMSVPMVLLLLREWYGAALALFVAAGASDGLDGYLAKRYGWHSRLGSILDPLADKLLLVVTYFVLGWQGLIPLWLVFAVIGRDIIVVIGALAFHALIGRYEMAPSMASKVNTVIQIVFVIAVLFSLGVTDLPVLLLKALMIAVVVTTLWSGADYVWTWGSRAYRARSRRNG